MKLLALVPYPLDSAPGQRYRIEQWAPYLKDRGIEVTLAPFADSDLAGILYQRGHFAQKAAKMLKAWVSRIGEACSGARYDAVYVYREASLIGPALVERLARARSGKLIYDFDDAVFLPYISPSNRYFSYLKFPGKTRALCGMASAVIAGNQNLADYARRYNSNVHVVPSTVSLRTYVARPGGQRPGLPVIGWTGSHSSVRYLTLVAGALQRLRQRVAFRVLIIGVEGFSIPGVETECRPWTSATEVTDLWEIDIGIMPLSDDPWARGKCGMKALQYMGIGIPAVVSPVGVNRDIVTDQVNGLHASTEDEWVVALARLLRDADLRTRLGGEARRTAVERFSAEAQVPRLDEIFRSPRT